ncbi:MAG: TonB-dependent receptor plug [Gemmatimonadetes bacterium]|nr:TonB-dependent receptor plug [Gemmatimonadota bacterium]
MMQTTSPSPAVRRARWTLAVTVATLATASSHALHAQAARLPAPAAGFSALQGSVLDSVHNVPLANAVVIVETTGRSTLTDKDGHYRIDSIAPGSHRVAVMHPLLDTIGVQMRTPAYPFVVGTAHDLDLAVPGGERLAKALCTPAQLSRGPAVMLGFVRDADTKGPSIGAKVELVYQVSDPIGRKSTTVRSAMSDSSGLYRICGIPADMSGKVQVFRNGVSSGEVPADVTDGFVALRGFSIVAQHQAVVEVTNDSGKVKRVAKGSARITGKVVDKTGKPLAGARVALQGGGTVAITRANGDFTLDSLPSGTQALDIRKLGYSATEQAVELSSNEPARATITMSDFVPTLAAMRIEAVQDKALADIGYLSRKQTGQGFYMDGKQINHESISFSDVMRTAPGLRVSPTGDGRTYVITDSRSSSGGCVNYYVDGTLWQTMSAGDIDDYVRPSELVAIEVYHGSTTPPQYAPPGQSGCATIVAWTVAKVRPNNSKKP